MALFEGTCVAMITPFTNSGNVDYDAFSKLIDFYIDGGVDALCVCGTTGEPSTMSECERDEVIAFALEKIGGRVKTIVGCGCNSTATTVANAIKAEKAGADGLLVVTPYYNKCTQRGLVEHYTAVANAVKIPVILYNVPSRTGVNILPATAVKLCEVKNIVGIKEASGNIDQLMTLCRLLNGKMDIYLGEDALTFVGMTLGAKGVISVAANVVPSLMSDIPRLCNQGKWEQARELQFRLADLISALFCEVNPIPVKKAMAYLGYGDGSVRLPLTMMEEENAKRLLGAMRELNLV